MTGWRKKEAFTIVELLVVVVVIAILAGLVMVGYNGIRVAAMRSAAQAELRNIGVIMQTEYLETGTYPEELPGVYTSSNPAPPSSGGVTLTMRWSGTFSTYTNLSPVQNGVLLATICQDLIDEGAGRAPDQGGTMQNYIMGCGNWNHNSMQVTAWSSRVWNTPISDTQLLDYAETFTSGDAWHNQHAPTVRAFYSELVARHLQLGGTFPIQSFWDSWANPGNGGVIREELPEHTVTTTGYCVEAVASDQSIVWHIDESGTLREGPCEL